MVFWRRTPRSPGWQAPASSPDTIVVSVLIPSSLAPLVAERVCGRAGGPGPCGTELVTLIAVCSGKGSPGVSTLACVAGAVWPPDRRIVIAECDPSGNDLAARFGMSPARRHDEPGSCPPTLCALHVSVRRARPGPSWRFGSVGRSGEPRRCDEPRSRVGSGKPNRLSRGSRHAGRLRSDPLWCARPTKDPYGSRRGRGGHTAGRSWNGAHSLDSRGRPESLDQSDEIGRRCRA